MTLTAELDLLDSEVADLPECTVCGEPANGHRGWCRPCYFRWYNAGKPESGPPPRRKGTKAAEARREDYAELRGMGVSVEEAAARVGIKVETARQSYEPPAPKKPLTEYPYMVNCRVCGQRRRHGARGWCTNCWQRWNNAGRPADGPPPPGRRGPRPVVEISVEPCGSCGSCGKPRPPVPGTPPGWCRGWCGACYDRWLRAGRPESGPPPPKLHTEPITCADCGRDGQRHAARGRCRRCYARLLRAEQSSGAPSPGLSGAVRKPAQFRRYKALRDHGFEVKDAARHLGIDIRTARRWENCGEAAA